MAWLISRVAASRPPGVSMRSTTAGACSAAARARPRCTYSRVAGPIPPRMSSSGTPAWAGAVDCAPDDADSSGASNNPHASNKRYPIVFMPTPGGDADDCSDS
jgi:hypothetical protein